MTHTPTAPTGPQNGLALLARLLLAFLFLPAGVGKVIGFTGTVGYIASKGLPMPEVGAVIALLVEILGALALIAGLRTRLAALVLAVFTVAAAVFFHNYWAVPEAQQMMQQINFNKNIAIAGGLLALAAFGAGGLSVDAKRRGA
ncbi:DoxX family protein [Xylophilus sp. ASV27]|uniref:DoxX family protein n=1 Tax=Xylophilus sp. ASV27 TaxID=2795129 RepID=UPI0018EB91CD|nr:DoxX family protein [Xylophilus sp. ASV27]